MNVIDRIKQALGLRSSTLANPSDELKEALGVRPTLAGVNVSERTALQSTTVFACVNILSTILASLPLHSYRRIERGKEKALNHPSYKLLHDEPNPEMTSYSFRQLLAAHTLLWGNGYAEVEVNKLTGEPVALWPLAPWRVRPERIKGKLFYNVHHEEKGFTRLNSNQVIHLRGLWIDGLKGISPIRANMQAVGLGKAAEEFGARFFGEGANSGGVIEYPGELGKETYDRLKKQLNEKHAGLGKSHRLMLLEEGMKYQRTGIPPNEAQFIETRRFQTEEICRLYNVPLHLVQEHSKNTSWGSGIEQMNLGFVIFTLRPHLVNWEQEINRRLYRERDQSEYFAEFAIEGLLRGDSKARSEFYKNLFYLGAISPNDIREKENMNPIEGGDEHFIQSNMMPLNWSIQEQQELDDTHPDDRGGKVKELKRKRSIRNRANIAESHKHPLRQVVDRTIRVEKNDVLAKAKKIFGERDTGAFDNFLDRYYEEHSKYLNRHFKPVFAGLAEAIGKAAADEIEVSEEQFRSEVDRFVEDYLATFNKTHIITSQRLVKNTVLNAIDEGEDPVEALEKEFERWEEVRAEKITEEQDVKLSRAVAKTVFAAGGVTRLVWVAGGSDPCEFCLEMDGKTAGIQGTFVSSGDEIEGKEGGSLPINQNTGHPPLHDYCECDIAPE